MNCKYPRRPAENATITAVLAFFLHGFSVIPIGWAGAVIAISIAVIAVDSCWWEPRRQMRLVCR